MVFNDNNKNSLFLPMRGTCFFSLELGRLNLSMGQRG